MGKKKYLSRCADWRVLRFLWHWRVATTNGLAHHFFRDISPRGAYERLWKMERAGFIRSFVDVTGRNYVYGLTKKGFTHIQQDLPPLREKNFKSKDPAFDLFASAILCGEGFDKESGDIEILGQQMLRGVDPREQLVRIPDLTHVAPDGLWCSKVEPSTLIALEIELKRKSAPEYEKAARYYENHREITKVLWVVNGPSLRDVIRKSIHKATDGEACHNFANVEDVIRKGWQAQIVVGPDSHKTISDIVPKSGRSVDKHIRNEFALDTRKSPHTSRPSEEDVYQRFSYWIGLKPYTGTV